jgi:dephospho-CoA kinase
MIRIGILGDIGSGKSYIAKAFGYPVFNADKEVSRLYKNNKKVFTKLNRTLPKYIHSFPIKKDEISRAILANKSNLRKIVKIIHLEVRKFKRIQISLDYKKKKSKFLIKNNFTNKFIKKQIKYILKQIY